MSKPAATQRVDPNKTARRGIVWTSPSGERLAAVPWRGLDGLHSILPAWRAVVAESAVDPLCNGPEWAWAYAKIWVPDDAAFGWVLENERKEPVAILPFRREPSRGVGRLRRAIHLVDGSFDSDYLDFPHRTIPAETAIPAETVAAAAIDLLSGERGIDSAVFVCLTPRTPTLAALRAELARRALPVREIEVPCLAMELPASFEDYLKQLKPRVRSKVRQSFRLAEESKVAFSWCDDPASMARHLEGLFALHAMRWNAIGKPGCFVEPKRRDFYALLTEAYLASKHLRFARAEIGGKPVAYQIGVVVRGTYYQLQEGFDIEFEKQRVATALRGWMVTRLIEEGVRRYDFMAGPSQHKTEWGGQVEVCRTLAFALPRVRARVAFGLRNALDRVRPKPGDPPAAGSDPESLSPRD